MLSSEPLLPTAILTAYPSLFLVGMMGAGKSTVGRLLARSLQRPFVDSDHELEARNGVRVATIFSVEGEAGFRQRESAMIDELSQRSGIVLATGGGAVLSAFNRECLATRGIVIYLRASPHTLWQRTRFDKQRPLLQTEQPRLALERMHAERDPLYSALADVVVDTGQRPLKRIVDALMASLEGLKEEAHSKLQTLTCSSTLQPPIAKS